VVEELDMQALVTVPQTSDDVAKSLGRLEMAVLTEDIDQVDTIALQVS